VSASPRRERDGVKIDGRASMAGVLVGDGQRVVIMGALNVSPESFYAGSVQATRDDLVRAAVDMVEAGAALVDVGARSTAPYLPTDISEADERDRLTEAVHALSKVLSVPISADTTRASVARAALDAGARVLNDVSGFADRALADVARVHGASVILMASPRASDPPGRPLDVVRARLAAALAVARDAGIPDESVVLDPGVGFFRHGAVDWVTWDVQVISGLDALRQLGRPLCVGVSRKSFLGALAGRERAEDRLAASLAATAVAVLHGAAIIRTHDVAATRDAVCVAERFRRP
jgi:dihydropteroate synthase